MRLARFEAADGSVHFGRLEDDRTARPAQGSPWEGLEFAERRLEVRRLLAPVEPANIFAIGRNYRAHVEETGARLPEQPLVFMKPTTAVIGPEEPIVLPPEAPDEVDFEAELAVVIGRRARNLAPEQAMQVVLGFTCANDVTARDCQRRDKQWVRAKGFDTFCPLGPCIVTPDEIDPGACAIRSRLNGTIMQDSNTSQMIYNVARLVSFLSHQFTLLPGTVVLTGTPDGVGFARQPPVFLRPGDRIEIEIEGIGTLANPVQAPQA